MKIDDPDMQKNSGIQDGLGCCYHALGDYEKALQYYDTALEMSPQNRDYWMHRAQCEFDQGHYE
jgi:tetratricopeptide (TPR) repeat protein